MKETVVAPEQAAAFFGDVDLEECKKKEGNDK